VREIAALLDELTKAPTQAFNQRLYATMILLIYSCGLRRREAVRLQVGDVDLERAVVFIRCTKFGKDRQIPIGPRVCEQLHEYHQSRVERLGQSATETAFFVQATGDPVWPGHLYYLFRGACTRAKIGSASRPSPRLHDLRHSFAVHRLYKWYLEGADPQSRLPLLSIYMGHVSEESTRHYLHLSQDLLRLAARPMERGLEGWLHEHSEDLAL
jgi:integrase